MRIDDLTLEELLELNELICRRIDELRARQDLEALKRLRLGQAVSFEGREGEVFGEVVKINRKTVVVHAEDNRRWKVPAGDINLLQDNP